jgi:hypothetical protein
LLELVLSIQQHLVEIFFLHIIQFPFLQTVQAQLMSGRTENNWTKSCCFKTLT